MFKVCKQRINLKKKERKKFCAIKTKQNNPASPLIVIHQSEQTAGIDDEFVQEGQHVVEAWSLAVLLLPAVQHQLVQRHGAAHWRREAVAFLNG